MRPWIIATVHHTAQRAIAYLEELLDAGVKCIRYNTAYGSPLECQAILDVVRAAKQDASFMLDLKGRQIRLVCFQETIHFISEHLRIGGKGDAISASLPLHRLVKVGDTLTLGEYKSSPAEVIGIEGRVVVCYFRKATLITIRHGMIVDIKGINMNSPPPLSQRDIDFLKWGVDSQVEKYALSFVHLNVTL